MTDPLRDHLTEELRIFRLAGRPGFRDRKLEAFSRLAVVQERAVSSTKNAIDDAIDALIEEVIGEAVGQGKQGTAIRMHLAYDSIPDDLLSRVAKQRGTSVRSLDVRHKERTEAAAYSFPYSVDHYTDAVLPEIVEKMVEHIAQLEAECTNHASTEPLFHVRDITSGEELFGDAVLGRPARLTGLVTRRTKHKTVLFLDLADGTGTIQLLIARSQDEKLWVRSAAFPVRSKIAISGEVARSSTGQLSIAVQSIDPHRSQPPSAREGADGGLPPTGIYLARLEHHFRSAIQELGFTEVGTRLISSRWPSDGVEPLRVLYDGFGKPFFLAPSPIPQLIRNLIDSPYDRLFSVSRCFTQTYRDPHVSVESVIVAAVASDLEIVEVLTTCNNLAVALYRSDRTAPIQTIESGLEIVEVAWPPPIAHSTVDQPEIQVFDHASYADNSRSTRVARLCWPFGSSNEFLQKEYVLAEGYSEVAETMPSLTCFIVNIELLLTILLEDCDVRRIQALVGDDIER